MRRPALLLACVFALALPARAAEPREITITFDDLPQAGPRVPLARAQAMTRDLLAALERHHVPAIGFVNEKNLYVTGEVDARIALLSAWLAAGEELGNHTFSHASYQKTPLAAYEEEIVRGETVTRMLLEQRGEKLRYFRHPFLQTGPTGEARDALNAFLSGRGYTVAPVTVDTSDWVFAALYADAVTNGDEALKAKLLAAYVDYIGGMVDFFEKLALEVVGRPIRHVLLLHASELNAAAFDAIASRLAGRGYVFVPLAKTLADPAYALPDRYAGAYGCSWLERWLFTKSGATRVKEEPDPPDWVMKLYRARPKG